MAHLLTQKDVFALVNQMVEDITGQQSNMRVVDTSSFISAGETILSYATENVMNAFGLLLGRIYVAARPYTGDFNLINTLDSEVWSHRIEKVSFYNKKALPSGAWNTDLYTNLAPGFTNGQNMEEGEAQSTKSMWEQNPGIPLCMYFAGSSVWDECITLYEVQLQQAFRSPDEFDRVVSGMIIEHDNDIELEKQAFRNSIVLNHIAGTYDLYQAGLMPKSVKNLTALFNERYGTSYTSAQLRSTYLKEFLSFLVATIKTDRKMIAKKSANYHWTPEKEIGGVSYPLLRHTPTDRQKLFMYEPLFIESEAMVLPEIFNDGLLKVNYEGVDIWQNENDPAAIDVTPAIPTAEGTQTAGDRVQIPYVVGCLFDSDAMMADFQLERADSTPLEARKLYRNIWLHMARNGINDFTEKTILYIMAD